MRNLSLILLLPMLSTIAACGQEHTPRDVAANEAIESSNAVKAEALPGTTADGAVFTKPAAVSPSVAPGVAFQYNYTFRVPGDRIEAVQDEHAAACETLGLSRCQITGLAFSQNGSSYPSGRMEFLLDPAIARKFGRDAIASVEKAEGVLATSNVSGENVGAEIANSQVRSAGIEAEVKRIEARLAGKGLAADERTELRRRAEELRATLAGEKQQRRTGETRIATTPVAFSYDGNMGIGGSGVFGDAWSASAGSMTAMLSMLLMLLGVVLPWLLPIAAIVLVIKSPLGAGLRRWWRGNTPLADAPFNE